MTAITWRVWTSQSSRTQPPPLSRRYSMSSVLTSLNRTDCRCPSTGLATAAAAATAAGAGLSSTTDCLAAAYRPIRGRACLASTPEAADHAACSGCLVAACHPGSDHAASAAAAFPGQGPADRASREEALTSAGSAAAHPASVRARAQASSLASASRATDDGCPPPAQRRRRCWHRSLGLSAAP